MKITPALILALIIAWVPQSQAGLRLPKDVRTIDQLSEARSEAESKGKSLGFLYTDINSTCGLCNAVGQEFIKELDGDAVIVYISAADWKRIPQEVQKAVNADKGKYIPKIFLFSPDLSTLKASVNYDDYKAERGKPLKQAKKALK